MSKIELKFNSIIVRLLIPMFMVLIIQSLLFSETILHGEAIEELNNNAMDILNERVARRKIFLENEIFQRWINISKFEYDVQEEMEGLLNNKDINIEEFQKNPDLILEYLEGLIEDTIVALRQQMVTGVFIVLESDSDEKYPGLYIRDLDPLFNPNDNSDIFIEKGPSSIAKKQNISLGRNWSPQFTLKENEDDSKFFYRPYKIAKEYPDNNYSDLGYWSKPFRLSQYDMEIITYSLPLIDANNKVYGVIGIELTTDYLRKILDYDEIIKDKKGSYFLGINSIEDMKFEKVVASGPMIKNLTIAQTHIDFDQELVHNNIYRMKTDKDLQTIYGSIHYLNLYNRNNPFEKDRWALIGIVEKGDLLEAAGRVRSNVAIALIMYLTIGIIGVIIAGILFVKPITELVTKLKESNPEESIELEKTNISEIDDLTLAIESLSSKVADSASKLSQIIGMVNIPIGAFEHILTEDRVFSTDGFFKILGIETGGRESKYINAKEFYTILKAIEENPKEDGSNIYSYIKEDGKKIWIYLNMQRINGKLLGIIEDVSSDIVEKKRIEYERDHDVLTSLINRRAFQVRVRKKMSEKDFALGAFVMWDLDNLKNINDRYGHDYGDIYIKTAAEILNEINYLNGIVARMSGDEFYAFIYGYKDRGEIRNMVEEIHGRFSKTFISMPDNSKIPIRASAGISWYPHDSADYDELIKYSDFAMYEVKNKEKGDIAEFNLENYKKSISTGQT